MEAMETAGVRAAEARAVKEREARAVKEREARAVKEREARAVKEREAAARACGTPRLNSSKSAWWSTRLWWHSPSLVCRHVAGARWQTGASEVPDVTKPAWEMPKRDVRLCSPLCD